MDSKRPARTRLKQGPGHGRIIHRDTGMIPGDGVQGAAPANPAPTLDGEVHVRIVERKQHIHANRESP